MTEINHADFLTGDYTGDYLDDVDLEKLAQVARNKGNGKAAPVDIEPIYVSGDLPKATLAAWNAIADANDPPVVFRYGGAAVRLGTDDNDRPTFDVLFVDRMKHEVARIAPWMQKAVNRRTGEVSERPVPPPEVVIRDMIATPAAKMPIPLVAGISEIPSFSENGVLCDKPGYNAENRMYYAPPPGIVLPPIPTAPTEDEVRKARDLLLEPLLDFDFAGDADLAHAIALGMLPYVREIIGPLAPLHLFDAPIHGSGKTLAARVVLTPPMGTIPFVTQSGDEEYRKRICSQNLTGKTIFFLDNVTRELVSSVLANKITSPYLTDRILGKSMEVSVPNRMIWVCTGNNVILSGELARRTVRCRIDPNTDQPWLRTGFRIPNLDEWIVVNRGRLVAAALTIVQAWVADRMPMWQGQPLGSFERWSRVMGGILDRAGIGGFLGNLEELYDAADIENAICRDLVSKWRKTHGEEKVGVKDLYPIALEVEGLDLGDAKTDRGQRTALGAKLRSKRNTVISVPGEHTVRYYKITPGIAKKKGAGLWMLMEVTPRSGGEPREPSEPF